MTVEAEILDRLPFAVIQVDQDERIRYWNHTAGELLGPSGLGIADKISYELLGSYLKAKKPEAVGKIHYYCKLALEHSQPSETVINAQEGKATCLWCIPLADVPSRTPAVVLILGGLPLPPPTSEKPFDRERLAIAGSLTHQLNQPLQIILGYVSLMLMDLSPDQPQYGFLNKVLEQVEEFNKVIQKLNQITRD
ncbi:MAG: histidine kinase dimerization/phospho-acceptor domain-containing protein [Desulfobacteraceae bacterium]